jgi:hypothetical protein
MLIYSAHSCVLILKAHDKTEQLKFWPNVSMLPNYWRQERTVTYIAYIDELISILWNETNKRNILNTATYHSVCQISLSLKCPKCYIRMKSHCLYFWFPVMIPTYFASDIIIQMSLSVVQLIPTTKREKQW